MFIKKVYRIEPEYNLVFVRGAVPGPKNGWLRLTDAFGKKFAQPPPFPTHVKQPGEDLSPVTFFVPKPEDISWEIEDIDKQQEIFKDIEQQKLVTAREEKSQQRLTRKIEYHKARKQKRIDVKSAKKERLKKKTKSDE